MLGLGLDVFDCWIELFNCPRTCGFYFVESFDVFRNNLEFNKITFRINTAIINFVHHFFAHTLHIPVLVTTFHPRIQVKYYNCIGSTYMYIELVSL